MPTKPSTMRSIPLRSDGMVRADAVSVGSIGPDSLRGWCGRLLRLDEETRGRVVDVVARFSGRRLTVDGFVFEDQRSGRIAFRRTRVSEPGDGRDLSARSRPFESGALDDDGRVHLRRDVLGHRVLDRAAGRMRVVGDLLLAHEGEDWFVASAFVAAMALAGIPVAEIRPTALIVNVVVAVLATLERRMHAEIEHALLMRFMVPSVVAAALGGALEIEASVHAVFLGLLLLVAAIVTLIGRRDREPRRKPIPHLPAIAVGASVGLLSGLTGIGGGVFLTPVILALGWCSARRAAAMAPPFILANSLVALLGTSTVGGRPTAGVTALCAGALVGAWFGARFARRRMSDRSVRTVLALVLGGAGIRLLM